MYALLAQADPSQDMTQRFHQANGLMQQGSELGRYR
jgi:hypothetical protein